MEDAQSDLGFRTTPSSLGLSESVENNIFLSVSQNEQLRDRNDDPIFDNFILQNVCCT